MLRFHAPCRPSSSEEADLEVIKKSFEPGDFFKKATGKKYGKGGAHNVFVNRCSRGVLFVAEEIRRIQASGTMDATTLKQTLKRVLAELAGIRHEIALATETEQADLFGRSRLDNPIQTGAAFKGVQSTSFLNNPQHDSAHAAIKDLMGGYLVHVATGQRVISPDDKDNPMSRYIIRLYALDDPSVDSILMQCFLGFAAKYPRVDKNFLFVGDIQVKIDGQFVSCTKHVSWVNKTSGEFIGDSRVALLHTHPDQLEKLLNQILDQWIKAILWDSREQSCDELNTIMADLTFYFGQALLYYRGSPAILKMLLKGTYYAHGFLPPRTVSETDEYCTAEYFPFKQRFREKFLTCFEHSPTAKRVFPPTQEPESSLSFHNACS